MSDLDAARAARPVCLRHRQHPANHSANGSQSPKPSSPPALARAGNGRRPAQAGGRSRRWSARQQQPVRWRKWKNAPSPSKRGASPPTRPHTFLHELPDTRADKPHPLGAGWAGAAHAGSKRMALITLEHVTYRYPLTETPALNDISLTVDGRRVRGRSLAQTERGQIHPVLCAFGVRAALLQGRA